MPIISFLSNQLEDCHTRIWGETGHYYVEIIENNVLYLHHDEEI